MGAEPVEPDPWAPDLPLPAWVVWLTRSALVAIPVVILEPSAWWAGLVLMAAPVVAHVLGRL